MQLSYLMLDLMVVWNGAPRLTLGTTQGSVKDWIETRGRWT
jgi:hypothetical protein